MILLHSGQEMRDEIDLFLAGKDPVVDINIRRRHTSRRGTRDVHSGFGAAWSMNYQRSLIRVGPDLIREFAFGRIDDYTRAPGSSRWFGDGGNAALLVWNPNSSTAPVIITASGTRRTYSSFSAYGTWQRARLETVTSLLDHELNFTYATSPTSTTSPAYLRLTKIVDSFGRDTDFYYSDPQFPNAVTEIEDPDGRLIQYTYEAASSGFTGEALLVTHTSPATSEVPAGATTGYRYGHRTESDDRLRLNLTEIVFPNEILVASDGSFTGSSRLAWTYATSGSFLGWVESHTVGNTTLAEPKAAGGTYSYKFSLEAFSGNPAATPNDPAIKVLVQDRVGNEFSYLHNRLGQILEETVVTDKRGTAPDTGYVSTYAYNANGLVVQSVNPMGAITKTSYQNVTHSGLALPTHVEMTPDPARAGVSKQQVINYITRYEPIYNRPYQFVDPRGYEPGNQPDDYTTTLVYDYMEDLTVSLPLIKQRLGFSSSDTTIDGWLAQLGITSVGDVNGDGQVNGSSGLLVMRQHPNTTVPSELAGHMPGVSVAAAELYRYNADGQLIWHQDAEENVHVRTYYAGGSSDFWGNPAAGQQVAPEGSGGFLRSLTVDSAATTSSRNSGAGFNPVAEMETYLYHTNRYQGSTGVQYSRNRPTTVIDGRGIHHDYGINELDQIVEVARASASNDSSIKPLGYLSRSRYDANGNLVALEIEEKGSLDGRSGFTVYSAEFDILDNMHKIVGDVGGLGVTERYLRDANENVIEEVRVIPGNVFGNARRRFTYDERNYEITDTMGVGTALESTTSNGIDANGNMVSWTDAEGGQTEIYLYDGFDRLVTQIERDGTSTSLKHDSLGQLIEVVTTGNIDVMSDDGTVITHTKQRLAASMMEFDERGREVRRDVEHRHFAGLGNDQQPSDLDSGALGGSQDGLISTVLGYDRLGRPIAIVDAEGDVHKANFDGADRLRTYLDPIGNSMSMFYDGNSNLVRREDRELGSNGITDLFVHRWAYDAVDRPMRFVSPNGQATISMYDSRDNVVRRTDPLRNSVDFHYDRLSRLTKSIEYLSSNGRKASPANVDTTQGGDPLLSGGMGAPDGKITRSQTWDGANRVTDQTDDRGNKTRYIYDPLDRLAMIFYGDGSTDRRIFNKDSELVVRLDQAGFLWEYEYDEEARLVQEKVSPPAGYSGSIRGTQLQKWTRDGLGRIWSAFADNHSIGSVERSVLVRRHVDSLGRVIYEDQTIGSGSSAATVKLSTSVSYQGARRVTEHRYPNGREVSRLYDALDRQTSVWEGTSLVSGRRFVGPTRVQNEFYANGTHLTTVAASGSSTTMGPGAGYDSSGRRIRTRWTKGPNPGGPMVTSILNTYNGIGGVGTDRRASETREHLGRTDTYGFDSAYRTTSFGRTGMTLSTRRLDGVDKMFEFVDVGQSKALVIDGVPGQSGLNQYSEVDGVSRTYDGAGGAHQISPGLSVGMDPRQHQSRLLVNGQLDTSYLFDGFGRRVAKVNGDGTFRSRFLYNGDWSVLEERDGAGVVSRQFIDGSSLDAHLQMRVFTSGGDATEDFYFHCNDQGSVAALSDAAGDVVEFYEYGWFGEPTVLDPQGVVLPGGSTVGNPYLFQGRRLDSESGLYHYRDRQYDPSTGSFLSVDPTGLWRHGQGNGYSAFHGDPVNFVDPIGHSPLSVFLKAVAKKGLKKAVKEAAEKTIKKKFFKKMTAKERGEFLSDIDDLLGLFDQPWWMTCEEMIPWWGDAQSARRLAKAGKAAWNKVDKLRKKWAKKTKGRKKPKQTRNKKHHKNAKGKASREPDNSEELYEDAVTAENGTQWAKDSNGKLHRFSAPSNGETHWNGSTTGPNAISMDNVPPEIRAYFKGN